MDIKKLFIGGIVGGVVFFLLGWVVYGILLKDFFHHNPGYMGVIERKEPSFLYLVAGQVFYGFLFAYILLKANVSSVGSGLVTGAVVGLLMAASIDFTMYGTTWIMSKKAILGDVAAATIMSAIAGAAIAAVVRKKQ